MLCSDLDKNWYSGKSLEKTGEEFVYERGYTAIIMMTTTTKTKIMMFMIMIMIMSMIMYSKRMRER